METLFEHYCSSFPDFKLNNIQTDWRELITRVIEEDLKSFEEIYNAVKEMDRSNINPSLDLIWNWTRTKLGHAKVIIVGESPVPFERDSGVAFSREQPPMSDSLRNMFRLLKYESRLKRSKGGTRTKTGRKRKPYNKQLSGTLKKKSKMLKRFATENEKKLLTPEGRTTSLVGWMNQGVVLLNSILTISMGRKNESGEVVVEPIQHTNFGWQRFTTRIVKHISLNKTQNKKVFILLGNEAGMKKDEIDQSENKVIATGHPSPRNPAIELTFFSSNMFTETNDFLKECGKEEIKWFELLPTEA